MRLTIYSWDLDVTGGGGWAISMREFAELFRDHGWDVRFVHSRVGHNGTERGKPLTGPLLDESQWADADVVWVYDSGCSIRQIIEHVAGRKPIVVMQPTPVIGWFEQWLSFPNVWVFVNSPVLEAFAVREIGQDTSRVRTMPRGRRWTRWPLAAGPRDRIGLPFGLKAPIRGTGFRPGNETNHSPFPRFATSYGLGVTTGLTPPFSALDVARGIHEATGARAIVATWVPAEFKDAPFVDVRQHIKPYTAMASFYAQCRLFLPSLIWESWGAQPLEAQHYGVPVVHFREPDVQEPQLSFSGIGYTTLEHAIAAGVRLVQDDGWWEYWSEKGRDNAARFDLDRLWPEYDAFFREVAGCP